MNLEGIKIDFLGDSITEGAGVAVIENRYDRRLAKEFGLTAVNYGIGGTRIAYQREPWLDDKASFSLYFCGRAFRMDPSADVIVVFGGTNDYGHGDAEFGSFEDNTPVTFCGAVRYLAKKLNELYPNAVKVFMTPAKRRLCDVEPAHRSPSKKMLADYVDAIIRIAKEEGAYVLDLYRELPADATKPEESKKYFADGLHLNDEGHALLAKTLGDFLIKLPNKKQRLTKMKLEGLKIDFLGDSITEGVGVENQENRYDRRLAKEFGITAVNYGVSGTRIAYQHEPWLDNASFDLYFCGRAIKMDASADVIVIFGGTNDYGHGDAEFGGFEDATPETFCGAVRYLAKKLNELYPNAKKVFMTPAKRFLCDVDPAYRSPSKKMLVDYVDAIIKIAKEEGAYVLDLYRDLPADATKPEDNAKYYADGLHFNDEGHALIAKALGDFLVKISD